ncbi:MAG: RNA 3'-terminal phosphate cyclase [Gammaproteobacteria bacterium]|nr:RNA 3'-terminal phosphate cyclase [Gammaproteobacteria bacterium]
MTTLVEVDGASGEGGGQILRSALTLSLLTRRPFRISRIRANRDRPGLRPQHLAAVRAASRVSGGQVTGDRVGSDEVAFTPGEVRPGDYFFDIGTAGAASLVLQTLLPPLALAPGSSCLTIRGGTHVPWSPCYHYLAWQWRFFLARLGIPCNLTLSMAGFYPRGGGEIVARTAGDARPRALQLTERGVLRAIRGFSAVANLPREIAERQRSQALHRLRTPLPDVSPDVSVEELPASSRGTVLLLLAELEFGRACCFALGARGKRAERVADEAVDALTAFLNTDAVVDPWLVEQLLIPLTLADGPSSLRTSEVTAHLLTNAEVIRLFLPVEIGVDAPLGSPANVRLKPATGEISRLTRGTKGTCSARS